MSETNKYEGHTPGPWRAEGGAYLPITATLRSGVRRQIGRAEDVTALREMSYQETEANAALIADAPELLRQRDALLAALQRISAIAEQWAGVEPRIQLNAVAVEIWQVAHRAMTATKGGEGGEGGA